MVINPTKTVNELITALPYIIDIEDGRKIYHSWRVAILSGLCAKGPVGPGELKYIFYAALLHDIGGVGFPIHIIHYLKRNDKISHNILLSHPIVGAQLVSNIPQMNPAAKIILDHHEWINGHGYPRAKFGDSISFGSQVIRIADSIDIFLQTTRTRTLKQLKDKMSPNIDKEYSKDLFHRAFRILEKDRFFYKILPRKNVPLIFKEIHEEIGLLKIPAKIDAVGKTLEFVAQIVDMKHPFTSGHSLRVSRYAMAIALAMSLGHDEVTRIRWAGLLHDIGKLSVSRHILDKPTTLNHEEYQKIQKHAHQTFVIMNMIPSLRDIALIAAAHHERFDGSGYPFSLSKEGIPRSARILALCDAFDAMTSNRPYRKPLTFEEACREIKKMSGTQFDPEIINYALPVFRSSGF
ncbi:MAG: HD domain-containing protein [Candidatus Omnitrophica bacterium]|nr:HD domain-containing protein [Candidatus Omnitrophota bacterium]MDD5237899.1 HD domain-containing protein [Candidatus Omnitrophota bacterium]